MRKTVFVELFLP